MGLNITSGAGLTIEAITALVEKGREVTFSYTIFKDVAA
jgi:hypothetical protein